MVINHRINSDDSDKLQQQIQQQLEEQQSDGKIMISGEYHTLFIEEEAPTYENITVEIDGKPFLLEDNPLVLNKEAIPKHKKFTLFVEMFGHEKTQLHHVLYALRKGEENDTFEIRIDSPGGYMKEGLTLYNIMREKFTNRTVTYLDSSAYSMGALLFSMGDQRIVYEHSSLMYHNYSSGAFGKGDNLKTYIEHEEKNTHNFFKNVIVDKGFLTMAEFDEMLIGRDFWFDCTELAQRGIATHVMVDGFLLEGADYLEYKDSELDIETYITIKINEIMNEEDLEVIEEPKPKKKKKKTEKKKSAPKKKKTEKKTEKKSTKKTTKKKKSTTKK